MKTHEFVKGLDGVLANLERINSAQNLAAAKDCAAEARQDLRKLRAGLIPKGEALDPRHAEALKRLARNVASGAELGEAANG